MEVRVKMTVEDDVADSSVQTSGSVQNVKGIAFLGADGDRINDGGIGVIALQSPLVIVQMEDMSFLDTSMDQPDFGRIAHVGPKNRRRRISIDPGTHGNIFTCVRMIMSQGQTVSHGFRAVADGRAAGFPG